MINNEVQLLKILREKDQTKILKKMKDKQTRKILNHQIKKHKDSDNGEENNPENSQQDSDNQKIYNKRKKQMKPPCHSSTADHRN